MEIKEMRKQTIESASKEMLRDVTEIIRSAKNPGANAAPEERACEPDPGDRSLMQCMTDAAAALKALRRCIGFGEVEVAVDSEKVSVAAILCGNLKFEVTSYGE